MHGSTSREMKLMFTFNEWNFYISTERSQSHAPSSQAQPHTRLTFLSGFWRVHPLFVGSFWLGKHLQHEWSTFLWLLSVYLKRLVFLPFSCANVRVHSDTLTTRGSLEVRPDHSCHSIFLSLVRRLRPTGLSAILSSSSVRVQSRSMFTPILFPVRDLLPYTAFLTVFCLFHLVKGDQKPFLRISSVAALLSYFWIHLILIRPPCTESYVFTKFLSLFSTTKRRPEYNLQL